MRNIKMCFSYNFVSVTMHVCMHSASAVQKNQELEFERNKERFVFLKVSTVLCALRL